jgi:hydrogenase nickel incorporation protein HypB
MKIDVRRNILEANQGLAQENVAFFRKNNVLVVNVMAAPGAGKTSTILKSIDILQEKIKFLVIEGDIASKIDAEKMESKGIPVVQINTGHMCHLDANMVQGILNKFEYDQDSILFIENVGNLVCPAEFSLGEDLNIVISSVPEGHDKPFKYPSIYLKADAVILNKMDTMDAIDFDKSLFYEGLSALNTELPVFEVSCKTGEGFTEWTTWLLAKYAQKFPDAVHL